MAVEGCEEIFTKWLTKKLKNLDVEDSVLAEYISSIVTTDDVDTDKKDVLKDIFEDLLQGIDTEALCSEILEEWAECQGRTPDTEVIEREMDLSVRVSQIVGKSVQPVLRAANRSAEEEKIREAILSRCCYVSDEEEECEADEGAASHASAPAPQNQNAESVAAAERARRDKMKNESQEKKAQDKVNREKQKAKQEERREKERKRTQKGERRR